MMWRSISHGRELYSNVSVEFYYVAVFILLSSIYLWRFKRKSQPIGDTQAVTISESVIFLWKLMKAERNSKETPLDLSRQLAKQKTLRFNFPIPFVVCNEYEMIREVQNSETWADRPIGKVFSLRSKGQIRGILQNNGESWKTVRRYTMKKLVQLGFGKKDRMISFLEGELLDLLQHVDSSMLLSAALPAHDLFSLSVANIVWYITAGEQFSRSDPNYKALKENTAVMTTLSGTKILLLECTLLRKLVEFAPSIFGFNDLFQKIEQLRQYFTDVVVQRQRRRENGEKFDDLIDCFLQEIEFHEKGSDESLKKIFCIEELVTIITDLFQAGMDTTSNTLESAVMLMIKHPEIQAKIQMEIDNVVGHSRFPNFFHDKQKYCMPYTMAALAEVNRIINMIPFNARLANADCTLGDMNIRKGTYAFLPLHCVRMDEAFWGDPNVFRPERFLDSNNNLLTDLINRAMAFGGGQRYCPGEIVAKCVLFSFLTGILQRYSLINPDELQELRMSDFACVTNRVLPFTFSAIIRQ